MKREKIGIVTWYATSNYGSQLQAFALYYTLKSKGYRPVFLNFTRFVIIRSFLSILPIFILKRISSYYRTKNYEFVRRNLKERYIDPHDPHLRSSSFSSVICGGDQIWAPNVFNPSYMLDFVPNCMNKVAYAPSIGLNTIPNSLVEKYKYYIKRINHVSIREEHGQLLLREQCGIDSCVVLDPTLLLDVKTWRRIEKENSSKESYIFCYFLNPTHSYCEHVKKYANKRGLNVYGISEKKNDCSWMNLFDNSEIGPCEFLGLIKGASVVITDSYHGTIFSLLFHREIIILERFSSDDKLCQNSRIYQLGSYFGISKNIYRVDKTVQLESIPISYDDFEEKLSLLRDKSIDYLLKSIS